MNCLVLGGVSRTGLIGGGIINTGSTLRENKQICQILPMSFDAYSSHLITRGLQMNWQSCVWIGQGAMSRSCGWPAARRMKMKVTKPVRRTMI